MFYIRADGNAEIGTGHIMRCLSIANAARIQNIPVTFIIADKEMEPMLQQQGFHYICLDSAWDNLDQETEKMAQLIQQRKIEKLLIDSYFVTPNYLQRLHALTHVAYIDDLNALQYSCSTLINYNIYADKLDYPSRYPDTRLLLGPKYAPLREEFQNLPQRIISPRLTTVLVTAGGSDLLNTVGQILSALLVSPRLKTLNYHIVSGRLNPHIVALRNLESDVPNITVHEDVRRMSDIFSQCDAAISAGGSTMYELSAAGIPSIVFAWADNQLPGVVAFGDGWMENCGDFREDTQACIKRITHALLHYRSPSLRLQRSAQLRALVDGQGALRTAQALYEKI